MHCTAHYKLSNLHSYNKMYTYNSNSCTYSVVQDQFWRDFGGKIYKVLSDTKGCGYTWVSSMVKFLEGF